MENDVIPAWTPGVAIKKITWALGKLGVSASTAPLFAPKATAVIAKVSVLTQPYGLTMSIDQALFEKALPALLFAVFVGLHDYAKVKTKITWL